jgi:hypothetical protein
MRRILSGGGEEVEDPATRHSQVWQKFDQTRRISIAYFLLKLVQMIV